MFFDDSWYFQNIDLYVLCLLQDLYGWTMDRIVEEVGKKNNCTFCGVFRRQALERGAVMMNASCIVTGHNADDIAETLLMNVMRGDVARLGRCVSAITSSDGALPRVKPLKFCYEKEIVMYAYFRKLVYFSTECVFAPNAYRGHARTFLKDLESVRPSVIMDIIHSGENLVFQTGIKTPQQGVCVQCGHVSSQELCQACTLLLSLNEGKAKQGVSKKSHKIRTEIVQFWPGIKTPLWCRTIIFVLNLFLFRA